MQVDRIWLLMARKLSNEASPAELEELDSLLRKNPDEHYTLEVLTALWERRNGLNDDEIAEKYEQHLQRMQSKGIVFSDQPESTDEYPFDTPKRYSFTRWLVAAGVLLCVTIALFYWLNPAEPGGNTIASMNEVTTPKGSKTQLRLPDSTVVWLNAGSKLTYPKEFGAVSREVNLVGEAYFEVKKSNDNPFIIHTNRMDIRVLGTTFNVKSYPGEPTSEAALIRGSIEVFIKNRPDEKIVLKPNEKIVVQEYTATAEKMAESTVVTGVNAPSVAIKPVVYNRIDNTVLETAWVDNKLVFDETYFPDMVKMMERWYGVTIQVENKQLDSQQFTGSFRKETLDEALRALQHVSDFTYEKRNASTIIIK